MKLLISFPESSNCTGSRRGPGSLGRLTSLAALDPLSVLSPLSPLSHLSHLCPLSALSPLGPLSSLFAGQCKSSLRLRRLMLLEPRYTPTRIAWILVVVHLVEAIYSHLVVME